MNSWRVAILKLIGVRRPSMDGRRLKDAVVGSSTRHF